MNDKQIKQLIKDGHMVDYKIYSKWIIFPVMTIYFDNHKSVNVMKHKWNEYWDILDKAEV